METNGKRKTVDKKKSKLGTERDSNTAPKSIIRWKFVIYF